MSLTSLTKCQVCVSPPSTPKAGFANPHPTISGRSPLVLLFKQSSMSDQVDIDRDPTIDRLKRQIPEK